MYSFDFLLILTNNRFDFEINHVRTLVAVYWTEKFCNVLCLKCPSAYCQVVFSFQTFL